MNNIIDELFQKVQTLGNNFTANTYQALATSMGPVFTLMLVVYLIFWGFTFWQGRGESSASGMAFRLLRVFVIFVMATSWGDFQTYVYDVANEAPNAVGNVIIENIGSSGGDSSGTTTAAIEQALSNVYLTGVDAASKLTANAGFTNPGPYIYGALVWVAVALFVGFSAFVVIFAKIMLWVLLSVAPLFIVLLLFNASSRFFNGWLTATIQNIVVPIVVYALLGFFLSIIKDAVQTLNDANAGSSTTLADIAPVVLAGFIGLFIMSQVLTVAAMLAGGTAMGIPSFARFAGVATTPFRNIARNAGQELTARTGYTREGRQRALMRDGIDTQFRALQDRRAAAAQQLKNR
jgi:type IV secretion system protein VirB6